MTFTNFRNKYISIWKDCTSDNPNKEFNNICTPIDIGKTNKELGESVLYSVWWFIENAFSGKLIVNNTAKTEFVVNKGGTEDTFTLTSANQNPKRCDIKSYMELFGKSFSMKQEIERLKKKELSK